MILTRGATWLPRFVCGALLIALPSGLLHADSLTIKSGASEMTFNDVQVQGVQAGEIQFLTSSGNPTRRPVSQITRLVLNDEKDFTAAEAAFTAKDYAKAADGYRKTIRSTAKAWLKDWCSLRLLETADKTGQFDDAVTAFIEIAAKDPAAAKRIQLTLPQPDSTYLASGATMLQAALQNAKDNEQKSVLLGLLIQISSVKNDTKLYDEAIQQLARINPDDPRVQRAAQQTQLNAARAAMTSKDYKKAIQLIDEQAPQATQPEQQAELLMIRAQALDALATGNADPSAWKDVALEYLRAIAFAGNHRTSSEDAPSNMPRIASDAMLRLAIIQEERLNDAAAAGQLYRQIVADQAFRGQPAVAEAQKRIDAKAR